MNTIILNDSFIILLDFYTIRYYRAPVSIGKCKNCFCSLSTKTGFITDRFYPSALNQDRFLWTGFLRAVFETASLKKACQEKPVWIQRSRIKNLSVSLFY